MKKNKIVVFGAGGCGINTAIKTFDVMKNYTTSGYAEVEFRMKDLSKSNIKPVEDRGLKLDKVESNKKTTATTIGAGGVRGANLEEINIAVDEIVDSYDIVKDHATLFIIISSAGGGFGPTFSPQLAEGLIAKGFTVLVVLVGDNRTLTYTTNTIRTLKTFVQKSKRVKKPISLLYLNNKGNDIESTNDEVIITCIKMFAILWSGDLQDLDLADMKTFLDVSKITTTEMPKQGINLIEFNAKEPSRDGLIATRVITTVGNDKSLIGTVSDKIGYITDETILEEIGDTIPIYITARPGVVTGIIKKLSVIEDEFIERNLSLEIDDIGEDDENDEGIIF